MRLLKVSLILLLWTILCIHDARSSAQSVTEPSSEIGSLSREAVDEDIPDLASSQTAALRRQRVRPKRKIDCDFYVENICLNVQKYPEKAIAFQLKKFNRNRVKNSFNGTNEIQGNRRQGQNENHKQHGGGDSVFLCPSEIDYVRPKRGRSVSGEWKDIVNVEDYTQTLRMERCRQPLGSCSYVSHHFKSECSQIYNYHRLLSWNKLRGLHMDIYKVPTCCSCSMKGYSYLYPPLRSSQERPRREPEPTQSFEDLPAQFSDPKIDQPLERRKQLPPSRSGKYPTKPRPSFLRGRRDNAEDESGSINYEYHPIISFF